MSDVIKRFDSGKLWNFHGGIHPHEMKSQSNHLTTDQLPLAKYFYIPLKQHIGDAAESIINVGDYVLKGQALTQGEQLRELPIHAPTSGKIIAIEPHIANHPSGLKETMIVLQADGKDQWIEHQGCDDYLQLDRKTLIHKIYQAGIAGLGGAVFPTANKIHGARDKVKLLIINGAECEPYITCDDRLMREHAKEIIEGCRILRHVIAPERVVIAVEDNKPKAISALKKQLKCAEDIELRVIPTIYPSGASKQLIQILTGIEVPHGQRSSSVGILMQNVGTAYAVKRAVVNGEPMIQRVVTLTGNKIRQPRNYWIPFGTPIEHLLHFAGYQADNRYPVFVGGPLMGYILPDTSAPITKLTNCLIAPDHFEYHNPPAEQNCIRCSKCSDVCPVQLLPQQLYWFARGGEHDKSKQYELNECIECGACAYVCPSNIPLIQYFREEKSKIKLLAQQKQAAEEAKQRFEAKEARMQREKALRGQRHTKSAQKQRGQVTEQTGDDPVAEALARIKKKQNASQPMHITKVKQAENKPTISKSTTQPPQKRAVAAAIARAKAKQAQAETTKTDKTDSTPSEPIKTEQDAKKRAVAAAIARAKAKQAQAETTKTDKTDSTPSEPIKTEQDAKKRAVAAAIARAKAKQAQAETTETDKTNSAPSEPIKTEQDAKKRAVAAAIARAKAKQMEKQREEDKK